MFFRVISMSIVAITFTSGCSTSSVVSVGENIHIVSSSGAGFDTGSVRENVYTAANKFCSQKGKVIETITFESVKGKLASHPPSAELKFKCISKK